MENPPPRVRVERIGHRGSPRERKENTLPGFLLALEHGADAVELDVHATKEGVVVVHHDEAVGSTRIAENTWSALQHLDLGGGARIPRLRDVLEAIGERATVYVELKGRDVEDSTIDVVRKHGHRFALHSFDHATIARVAAKAPDIARGILLDSDVTNAAEELRRAVVRTRPRDVWPHWSLVNPTFMAAAREAKTRVIAWTVNSPVTAKELVKQGVHGLCSDDVRLLVNL
jgi:glycerophosphoryl diester phosphodiesterase